MEASIGRVGVTGAQRRLWALAEIGAVFVIALAVLTSAGALGGRDPVRQAVAVAVLETFLMVLIWWSQRRRGLTMADLGLTFGVPNRRTVATTFGWSWLVFIATAAAFIALTAVLSLFAGEPQAADVAMYDYLRGNYWAVAGTIASVWVTASFAEEVIYRGFMIHRLEEVFVGARRATAFAVLVGGLLFGAIHYPWGLTGMLQTAVVGIALGAAYVSLDRRLWIVILVHAYLDTILFVQIFFGTA